MTNEAQPAPDAQTSSAPGLDAIKRQVDAWFSPDNLQQMLADNAGQAQTVGLAWLARAGKRWRPLLTLCVWHGLRPDRPDHCQATIETLAVAVECFHKASLIHDDIEDNDHVRYDQQTLDCELGAPIALNVGDLLVGQGYQLLTRLPLPDAQKIRMLTEAADCHCRLCLGQGEELAWMRRPRPLDTETVLAIFRNKTAPAFIVALQWAAIAADASETTMHHLRRYGNALGTAYQIRDDLDDALSPQANDLRAARPSLLLALAYEQADPADRRTLQSFWTTPSRIGPLPDEITTILEKTHVIPRGRDLLATHLNQAHTALTALQNPQLQTLLRAVTTRIFNPAVCPGHTK